ncbi:MAG: NTP transferase domain-containing protein [Gammaproteobacteria bacterium]
MKSAAPLNGLVLAGGRSRRFGQDKAALTVRGKALLERAVDLLTPRVNQVFVSVRPDQRDDTLRSRFSLLVDTLAEGGPPAGLLAAHARVPTAAWLVIACDLAALDAEALEILVAARQPAREATAYEGPLNGQPEPLCAIYEPVALARLSTLAEQGGNLSPRDLLVQGDTELLRPRRVEALANVNRPADLEALQNRGLC